jgi:hypothetical protein
MGTPAVALWYISLSWLATVWIVYENGENRTQFPGNALTILLANSVILGVFVLERIIPFRPRI